MSDDNNEPEEEGSSIVGPIPIPVSMLKAMLGRAEHDHSKCQLDNDARIARLERFLDTAPVDYLLAVQDMLVQIDDNERASWFLGQIYTILRVVHGVDPHTGETHEEKMSRLTLGKTGEGA